MTLFLSHRGEDALKAKKMRVVCWGVISDELGIAMADAGGGCDDLQSCG